ncbi:C40 family peptidase [Adlercreutzia caecimuris]|jgi:cell wall-associated NlpC family hydrolase|uniref:C40 family peptidase n=1 Tax=Adlercreutzia caecimuris TaxID=671266 RepID=UPI0025AF53D4|nr:C40 family peptidase [Adlercreutzia caecimuris]
MLIHGTFPQRVRTLVLACALSATMVAMSAPEASADQGAIESPFTKVEDFASDIKDYVGSVADKAEKEAARKQCAADRAAVVAEADDQLGVPYVYGGTTPSGFDCSGFTRWVYEHALGIDLPRTAAEQSALGKSVSMDKLKPGDLLFWGSGSGVYHVGIYAGDGEYIHASTGGGRVMRATFDYFAPSFAKRLI